MHVGENIHQHAIITKLMFSVEYSKQMCLS